jgi:hypothetical protein
MSDELRKLVSWLVGSIFYVAISVTRLYSVDDRVISA